MSSSPSSSSNSGGLSKVREVGGGQPHIVIVGAGIAGIATAIRLKKDLHFDNFTIYEKAVSVGGTWRDNTYPGCGSDVPGHWYSLSSDLNPNWQRLFATQPELCAYWEGLWHKHGLEKHTRLGVAVRRAEWDAAAQRYSVTVQTVRTGEQETVGAAVLFYAIGGFQGAKYPADVGGLEAFKGELFHSAEWRQDVILKGKRVGVIGNGCSAAQFIPEISADPSVEVINFARTPQWFVPKLDYRYPHFVKWIFAHVPFVMRWYRNLLMARADTSFLIFRKNNKLLLALTRKTLSAYIRSNAPKEYVDKLIPSYAPGCKRIIVDPDYLSALHRPNVSLRWDGIDSLVEEGVKLKNGEIVPLDVVIFATGYTLESVDLKVRGRDGTTIHDYFDTQGGATAYLGSCYPGFPNLFTLLGPNVASGHASVIFSHEAQINHALQLVKPVIEGKAKSFEVTAEATDKYNDWLQKRLSTSVWTDCNSYYQAGGNNKTKNVATFPGPVTLFWWLCRYPRWDAFRAVGAEAWIRQRRHGRYKKYGLFTLILSLAVGLGYLQAVSAVSLKVALLPRVVETIKQFSSSFLA